MLLSLPVLAQVTPTIAFTGPATYVPGSATQSTYTLVLGNTGATTESSANVTTTFPASATVNWSCGSATGAGTSCPGGGGATGTGNLSSKDPGTLAQNGTVTFTFLVTFASSTASAPLVVTATMSDSESGGAATTVNDSVSSVRDPDTDLEVNFINTPPTSYVPGNTISSLTVRVRNNGPTDSPAATVTVTLPAGTSGATWTCAGCTPASGSGNVSATVALADAASSNVVISNIAVASSLLTSPLAFTATAQTLASETAAANNTETLSLTRDPKTDYAIAFNPTTATTYTPGTTGALPGPAGNTLTVRVTNNGPTDSGAAAVAMTFPTEVASVSWSCSTPALCSSPSGTGSVATNVTLANDASVDIDLVIAYRSNALTSPLNLTATVTAASGEDDTPTTNNSATKVLNIARRANLSVLKTGPAAVNPGSGFIYEITVRNLGPSDIGNGVGELGALLGDTFAAQLQGDPFQCGAGATVPCWRYCSSDNGVVGNYLPDVSCPGEISSGTGSINNAGFKLRAGSSSKVLVYAAVGGLATGSVSNSASVSSGDAAVIDSAAGNNSSGPVVTNISINTDIRVLKTDNATTAVPGLNHSYQVTVSNEGFVTANNVAVSDTLPLYTAPGTAGFNAGSISWQCTAFDGACCNTNSANCGVGTPTAAITNNVLGANVDLPGQSRVVFTVSGRLNARASGTLSNTATATLPAGVTEGDPSNNSATDNNTLLTPTGSPTISKSLTSLVSLGAGGVGPPYRLRYLIRVSNNGPSFINNATLSDPLTSLLLDPTTASWNCLVTVDPTGGTDCVSASGTGALSTTVRLDPGGALEVALTVDTTAIASGEVINTAELSSSAGNASASLTSGLSGEADLTLTKTDLRANAIPGDATDYLIRVTNAGPDDVFGARVTDLFAPELESVSWTCAATTPVPGDLSEFDQVGAANTAGNALAASADGRHVYVVGTAADALFVFTRDAIPGLTFGAVAALETEVEGGNDPGDSGPAVTGLDAPIDVALTPDGSMLYVLSQTAIVAFNRTTNIADPNYGKVAFAGSVTTGMPTVARQLVVTNQNLFVSGDNVISIYRRDQVSGLPIHDIQHSLSVPAAPGAMALSTTDNLLFVASSSGQVVSSFAINTVNGATPIGRLTFAATVTHANLAGITDLVVALAQRHLYAAAGTAAHINLLKFTVATQTPIMAATLTLNTAYSAATLAIPGTPPNPLAGSVHLALAPDGEHLLAVNRAGSTLLQLRRDVASGGLAYEAKFVNGTPAGAHQGLALAADVAFSSDGRHVLIASAAATTPPLTVYARRAPDPLFAFIERDKEGDALTPSGTLAGLTAVADVVVSGDGDHVYAIGLEDHSIVAFTRNSTSGLTPETAGEHLEYMAGYVDGVAGISGLQRPSAIQISRDGLSVFVSSEERNSLAVFDREANDASPNYGKLTFRQVLRDGVGGVDALLGARGIAVDHDGRHVYVAASFEAAISVFTRDVGTRNLTPLAVVRSGSDGVTGLNGIRDLVVSRDGAQVLGVSAISNAVVAFNRDRVLASANFGRLSFVQARVLGAGDKLVSITLPESADPAENEHVYVTAETGNRLYVLRRILDPGSTAVGTLQTLFQYNNNAGGIARMNGPRDVQISADGERVYVGAQFGHSVLVFDRDTNRSSAAFGSLTLLETRSDGVDGVDGLNSVYGIAVSEDSRNVYAAGFGDNAVASFVVGTGSSCSAGGSGDINDDVDIGVGGTLEYRISARIRPDALGTLSNNAAVALPPRFSDDNLLDNSATDATTLTPRADVSVTKTNDRVSVVAGETVRYEIVVRNSGLSNLDNAVSPFTLTDTLGAGFDAASAQWSCVAAGSGALEFVDSYVEGVAGVDALGGVSGLALTADLDGAGPLGAYLASASVTDNALNLFVRDPLDGRLTAAISIVHGSLLNAVTVDGLAGARAVAASADGQFLYVASRISDAVSVFKLSNSGGQLRVDLVQTQRFNVGLDQAVHLVLSPGAAGQHLYVAGANDDAIAVYARDAVTGMLTWIESEQNGVNDASDAGGPVAGLDGVEYLAVSADGAHVYALSGSGGSISTFARAANGRLSYRNTRNGNDFGVSMAGASSAVLDTSGEFVYVTAADANRVLVLTRDAVSGSGTFGDLTFASSVAQDVDGTQGLLAPSRAQLTADGVHLYVTARSGGSLSWFIRDPADGTLTFLGLRSNESAGVDGLSGATDVVIDNALNQVYVAGTQQSALAQFERQTDSFCPTSGSGSLNAIPLRIAAGGSITITLDVPVTSTYSGALVNTVSISTSQDTDPSNNTAQDADTTSVVADLAITKTDGLAEFDGLAGAVAMTGDGAQIYVAASDDNAIGVYDRVLAVGPQFGSLAFNSFLRSGEAGVLGLAAVSDILLSGDGDHVYATSPTDSSVATFRRDRGNGRLSFVEVEQNGIFGVGGMSGARAMAHSPDGAHVYVAGEFSNAIATFQRDIDSGSANYGRLTYKSLVQNAVGGVDGIGEPVALQVAPDGRHVYVLGAATNSVAVFARNPNAGSSGFGQLSFVARYVNGQGGFSGLAGVRSLLINAAGTSVYVLAADTGNLVRLTRDVPSGALSPAQVLTDGLAGSTGESGRAPEEVEGVPGTSGLLGASRMRFAPGGAWIYVAGSGSNAIGRFAVDGGTGAVSFVARVNNGDPAPLTGGQVLGLRGVRDVLVAPDGTQLYSVSDLDNAAAAFERTPANGSLSFRQALFDGLGGVAPGESVSYVIVASNNGPSNVVGATVTDVFPDAFDAIAWTCTSSGGALCLSSGIGSISTPVNLPVGGRVTIVATGVVGEAASGRLSNTATITSSGTLDPVAGNNSATDADTVLSPAMDLVVNINNPPTISVPGMSETYEVVVSNLGPTYASGALLSDAIPPALYNVDWTCLATPVAGSLGLTQSVVSATTNHTAIAVGALGNFVYTAGSRGGVGAVVAYARSPLDGSLSEIGVYRDGVGGVTGLNGAADLILSSDERFVYVASTNADAVALFSRNITTGLLTFIRQYQDGTAGIDGLGGARALLMHPGGGHLYVAGSTDDAIAVFAVNAANGALTPTSVLRQTDAGVDGLNGVTDLAWSAGNTHLLAVASANQSLSAYARNISNGALSFAVSAQEFQFPTSAGVLNAPVALSVYEDQIFVAATVGNRVSRFRFNGIGTPSISLDFSIANGSGGVSGMIQPRGIVYDPDQARLYVISNASGALHLFSLLGAQPELLEQRNATASAVLSGGTALALSHNGKQLYTTATSPSGGVGVWARERGSRCAVSGTRELGEQTVDIAPGGNVSFAVGGDIFANALGSLVYSASVQTRVASEELNPADNNASDTNTLQPAPNLSIAKSDGLADVVAGTSLRYTIDVANAGVSDALLARVGDQAPMFPATTAGFAAGSGSWSCSANLPIAFSSAISDATAPALTGVGAMATSADGTQMFAVNGTSNALLVLPRAPDGTLSAPTVIVDGTVLGDTTVAGLTGASNLAMTPDGRHLLVTAAGSNSLLVFARDAVGALRFVQKLTSGSGGVTGLLGATDVVIALNGRRVFVAATTAASHTIAVFNRDPVTGLLSFVERVADGLGTIVPDSNVIRGIRRLHLTDDGRHLYAVATLSNALSRFSVNVATGSLTYQGAQRSSGPGLSALAGARDLVAAPGDTGLYALGSSGIVRFARADDGALTLAGSVTAIPGLVSARSLTLDAFGSRLYLSDAGGIHVFARDWNNGALDHRLRFSPAGGVLGASNEMLFLRGSGDLYSSSATPGVIALMDERPLSRCLSATATTDAIATDVDLGAGGDAKLLFDMRVHPSARGVLSNTATIQPGSGVDPGPGNNSEGDTTNILVRSDLSIAKTGPVQVTAGTAISYQIQVRNAGPSNALGIVINDAFSAVLLNPTWACVASGGATCPASGSGSIALTTNLNVGGMLSFTINAQVNPAYVGVLQNQASVVPESGAVDPTPTDHVSTVQTTIVAVADVGITKSDGVSSVTAGTPVSYQINLGNAGPSNAPMVRVSDVLPPTLQSATWTCAGTGGASCPPSGNGDVDFLASMPVGSSLQLVLNATVASGATGSLTNSATATVQGAPTDPVTTNNIATDTDTVLVVPDLVLDIEDLLDPYDPGGTVALPYRVQLHNNGPSDAHNVLLELSVSNSASITWPPGCVIVTSLLRRCSLGTIPSGTTVTLTALLSGMSSTLSTFSLSGSATTSDQDPILANNATVEVTQLVAGANVRVSINDERTTVPTGYQTTYRIVVDNVGSVTANNVAVLSAIAPELINASWTCSSPNGAVCAASGSGAITDTVSLARGQSVVYLLRATVDPDLDVSTPRTATQQVTATVPGGLDFNAADNSASDVDVITPVLFADGFEDLVSLLAPATTRANEPTWKVQ